MRPLLLISVLTIVGFISMAMNSITLPQTIQVALDAPDSSWSVKIERVYEVDDELWVVARAKKEAEVGAAVITKVSDSVNVPSRKKRILYFVLGKTWNWQGSQPYQYVNDPELEQRLAGKSARLIYDNAVEQPFADISEPADEFVKVQIRGKLATGVVAIGGETTGTIITSGNIAWELAFDEKGGLNQQATKLHRKTVTVTGTLQRRSGVEVKDRWIVKVSKMTDSRLP